MSQSFLLWPSVAFRLRVDESPDDYEDEAHIRSDAQDCVNEARVHFKSRGISLTTAAPEMKCGLHPRCFSPTGAARTQGKANPMPDASFFSDRLEYNRETGVFRWIKGKRKGRIAGSVDADGYRMIWFSRAEHYLAHRVAWVVCNGSLASSQQIDHINGNPRDNRLCNLRVATNSQNQMNRKSTTGLPKGVTFLKNRGNWQARITIESRRINLGVFPSREEAELAYISAAREIFGSFARHE